MKPPARRRPGRPPALDAAKRDVVVALLTAGWSRARAACYAGVAPQTLLNTAARDADFAARVDRAEAAARLDHARNIAAASGRSWRASAWALERLAPERFAPPPAGGAPRGGSRVALAVAGRIVAEETPPGPLRERMLLRLADAAERLG